MMHPRHGSSPVTQGAEPERLYRDGENSADPSIQSILLSARSRADSGHGKLPGDGRVAPAGGHENCPVAVMGSA